ncbi:MAG: transglutaminase N-terminal domain-containing protein, partial [Hyphomonas sp.]
MPSHVMSRKTSASTGEGRPMRLKIQHASRYTYTSPVSYGLLQLRQTPRSRTGQSVLSWHHQITGG